MKAEIIAVGTELLLGEIVNTNAQFISVALSRIGVDVLYHTVVGDNEERIAEEIARALSRSDVLIITGGLGPTHDDLTREALAGATGRKLERRAELEKDLRERFNRMGRVMAEGNVKQADQPSGAEAIQNPRGTAPGIALEHEGKRVYAVPGVPSEMQGMLADFVIPNLSNEESGSTLLSRYLKVAGMGESDVAQRIKGIINELDSDRSATIALLASAGEVRVRITAKAESNESALRLIKPVEEKVSGELGSAVYGADEDTLEKVVADLLRQNEVTVATAESITGGFVVSRLVGVPGASEFLSAGYVTYATEAKLFELGIPKEILDKHGAVSKETAIAMAQGARDRAHAKVGLSTTGEAGPEANEAPVGTVFLGLSWDGGSAHRKFVAPGPRDAVRLWASQGALNLLRLWLLGEVGTEEQ